MRRRIAILFLATLLATLTVLAGGCVLGRAGASALLHPSRRPVAVPPPPGCQAATWDGDGVRLAGWNCPASAPRRGSLIYLHGIADNRTGAAGLISRFGPQGLDVVAYDSRAHGESTGDVCTYGYYEKQDLARVVDALPDGPVVLLGTSLGAAVALQHAARDPRIAAVIAVETFSDLRTVARERAPFFFTAGIIARAFLAAEQRGGFIVDQVSPMRAARAITAPVLLIHGDADTETPPEQSRRVYRALKGPRRLRLVPGAGHNRSLRPEVWAEIDSWIRGGIGSASRTRPDGG